MILRIEIPQELIRQDAEIVIKVSNRNNALGYVIENGSKHDAQQIAKEDMNGDPTLGEYVRELTPCWKLNFILSIFKFKN